MDEADSGDTAFSTFNISHWLMETPHCHDPLCEKNLSIPSPSLCFAFGNAQHMDDELTSKEQVLSLALSSSAELSSNMSLMCFPGTSFQQHLVQFLILMIALLLTAAKPRVLLDPDKWLSLPCSWMK